MQMYAKYLVGVKQLAFAKLRKKPEPEPDLKELHRLKSQIRSEVYRTSFQR